MDIAAYLQRIGFTGTPRPDLTTLHRIQAGHHTHIPYENLDIQFGRTLTFSPAEAFDKLVTRRRGGWCYEHNTLLHWALTELGFDVMAMAGAVMRVESGDGTEGGHLVLSVMLERPYIVDAGFGDGFTKPIPLEEGWHRDHWRHLRLERLDAYWWRLHNDAKCFTASFDFQHKPADWDMMQKKSDWLQTSPDSIFVQNPFCIRSSATGFRLLIGRILKTVGEHGRTNEVIDSADRYEAVLAKHFDLAMPQVKELWPRIVQRHEAQFASGAPAAE